MILIKKRWPLAIYILTIPFWYASTELLGESAKFDGAVVDILKKISTMVFPNMLSYTGLAAKYPYAALTILTIVGVAIFWYLSELLFRRPIWLIITAVFGYTALSYCIYTYVLVKYFFRLYGGA
jgi:hypothetical protein